MHVLFNVNGGIKHL